MKNENPGRNKSLFAVVERYQNLYKEKFGIRPEIRWNVTANMVSKLLKNHSLNGLIRVIELYFEDPSNELFSYDLKGILSGYTMNKYLPRMKYDPKLYDNADELNKDLY